MYVVQMLDKLCMLPGSFERELGFEESWYASSEPHSVKFGETILSKVLGMEEI
jgi:hypothetical protein